MKQTRASNYPLRGAKYSWLEGGIRTTAWVTGGVLPAAMRGKSLPSSHLIAVCDWHVTFLALAGVATPANGGEIEDWAMEETTSSAASAAPLPLPGIDGIDMWPVLSGKRATPLRNEVFVGSGVLISGDFKLIATTNPHDDARWSGPRYPKVPANGSMTLSCSPTAPCLFDVVHDLRCVETSCSTRCSWLIWFLCNCLPRQLQGRARPGESEPTVGGSDASPPGHADERRLRGAPAA